jgi:hypothetical protein
MGLEGDGEICAAEEDRFTPSVPEKARYLAGVHELSMALGGTEW